MDLFKNKIFWLIALFACFLTASFALFLTDQFSYILLGLVFLIVLIIFILYPQSGLYLIAFFYPFYTLEFIYGDINVPYVDLFALILFTAWLLRTIFAWLEKGQKLSLANFPALGWMLIFIACAFLSLLNVDREWLLLSLKYVLRPLMFFYLMYVILPVNLIDSRKKLFNIFKIMLLVGFGLALMGLWSLIFPPFEGLKRAVPLSILGVYPLGTNHNALAEIFIIVIPLALILYWQEKNIILKSIYLIGALIIACLNLLTLSRAGWLAMFAEILLLVALKYRQEAKKMFTSYLPYVALLFFIPIVYLMYMLFATGVVSASDANRLKLIEIAWTFFKIHPLIGNGAGTYTLILSQVKWYLIEYGDVLDAHGFIFKTLAELGILGTISFLALLSYILYLLFKGYNQGRDQAHKAIILGCFLAVFGAIIFQAFGTSYFVAKMWLPIGLGLASLKLAKSAVIKKESLKFNKSYK